VANPASGRDVRRLVANAATSTLVDKIGIVRRVAIGAMEAGATRFVVLPDPSRICHQALHGLGASVEPLDLHRHHDESDSTRAAIAMAGAGCRPVVVLGGDGTSRAVVRGWPDAPLVPISTGTNNVFPYAVEATVAGAAAGLVATGRVPLDRAADRAKVVRVEVEGEDDDLALIDAVLTRETTLGAMGLFVPEALATVVLTRAEPASVGMSALGGTLHPCGAGVDRGVVVHVGGDERHRIALSPGHYDHVAVERVAPLALGEVVEVRGPGLLAFDGERQRRLADGQRARLRVERDGPWVVDVGRTLELAAGSAPEAGR
jgi:hypothetical protein